MNASTIYTDVYLSGSTAELSRLMPREEAMCNVRNGVYVVLVEQGQARIKIDQAAYNLSPGYIVLVFPFHSMASEQQSDDFRFRYLYFDFDFMSDFPLLLPPEESEQFGATPCLRVDECGFSALSRCYDTMWAYYAMPEHPSRDGIVKAQLFTFVAELLFRGTDRVRPPRACRAEQLTADFFHLLHRHYQSQRSLAFYAAQLCVTTKYLSKVIRRTTGQTVYFWIEVFLIKAAKLLLRTSSATVTEIAEQLNFPNSSFFAKFFRRHTGCSPVEFRIKR